jgi:uncharacterized phage-associated protein
MPRPYRPLALANSLIAGFGYVDGIDHMKLQKLVYLAHGWWLAYHDSAIINESPQVWRYGPVFASMYHALKGFGDHPIRLPQRDILNEDPPDIDEADDEAFALIDWTWARYGGFSGVRLSDMTHAVGTPWRTIAEDRKYRVPSNFPIPDDIIKHYFREVEPKRLQGLAESVR